MGEDFSEKTKRILADGAGHLCSICTQPTTCSDEGGKPFRIADAAHIVGASSEGPRGDDPIAHDKASPENGIWLCARCHRSIYGDPNHYSSEELRAFKEETEERMDGHGMIRLDIIVNTDVGLSGALPVKTPRVLDETSFE